MKPFKHILCYVGTETSEVAISRAVSLAVQHGASLTVMDVVKPMPKALGLVTELSPPKELEELVVRDHRRKLLDRMAEYSDTAISMEVVVATGDPATEIIRHVVTEGVDLVVKTANGFSPAGRLFGSVARSLLRMCPCPVWLLKPEIHGSFDRVVAAIDLDAEDEVHQNLNREILESAFSIAASENAELHVVNAWGVWMEGALRNKAGDDAVDRMIGMQESKIRRALDELLQAPMADDKNIHIHLKQGDAPTVIRTAVDEIEADLIVMGTVCRTGVDGFLIGNTAESIIPELTCSMLALKPQGFVSPIQAADTAIEKNSPSPVTLI
tara:strand:+ start:126608 stop:127585 length:978 start_codon:yes stop_codon:yes gene_type:complete